MLTCGVQDSGVVSPCMITCRSFRLDLRAITVALVSPLGFGCAATSGFTNGQYANPLYGYEYDHARGPLSRGEWKLDNYQLDAEGNPSAPKRGETSQVVVDADGDGDFESTGKHPDPDLRYVNLDDDGVIAIRTIPVSADLSQKNLKILLDRWVNSLSGEGSMSVYDQRSKTSLTHTKTYSTRIIAEGSGKLSGYDAHYARVEIANVEQLKLNPSHRDAIILVVLSRSDYAWKPNSDVLLPVYVLATYKNHPDFFEADVASFEAFLKGIKLTTPKLFPEGLATECKLPDATTHFLVTGSDANTFSVLPLEPLNEAVTDCLNDEGAPLLQMEFAQERPRLLVYRPTRKGDETVIPTLTAPATGETPEPATGETPKPAVAEPPVAAGEPTAAQSASHRL